MAIKYLAGDRLIGTAAERAALSGTTPAAVPQTSWKQLAKTTLTQVGNTLDSGTFTAKDNLMILIIGYKATTGQIERLRFNADDGSNYARRYSEDGGSDYTEINQDHIELGIDSEDDEFAVLNIRNIAGKEKLVIGHTVSRNGGTGASNLPKRLEVVGKWANTSDAITRVQVLDKADEMDNNNLGIGSEMVVLGCDDDEADSGTNFWQELNSTKLTSNGTSDPQFDTGVFDAKKYLLVQGWIKESTDPDTRFGYGSSGTLDAGSNYAWRYNDNGGSDGTSTSSSSAGWHNGSNERYINFFVINRADKEKLYFGEVNYIAGSGASSHPVRREVAGKWADVSNQIRRIVYRTGSMTIYDGSSLRVWGSN